MELRLIPSSRDRRRRAWILHALGLYLAFLLVTPFLHHDFTCHQRTPGHCQACRANAPAPRALENPAAAALHLDDVGSIESAAMPWVPRHVPLSSPGRSPPA